MAARRTYASLPGRPQGSPLRKNSYYKLGHMTAEIKHSQQNSNPHVVVIGSGFGGLYAVKNLARAPLRITIIDRSNHHLFQPLLYQVATAAISPGDIAQPIRKIFPPLQKCSGIDD